MSPVLEKYNIAFAYSDDRAGTLSMSATPALLADYMNGFNTMQKAGRLKYDADSLLKQNKQCNHLPAPADDSIIVTVEHPYAGLSRIDNESLTLDSFSLPLADLAEIAEAWRLFMTEYKYRKVEVAGGEGIIDIISDGFANALVIKTAVAVSWPDCAGSIGEYYSVSQHTTADQMALAGSLNQVVNTGTDSEILAAASVFLNLFTDGVYHIAISEIDVNTEGIGHDNMMIYHETVADADKFNYRGFDYNDEEPYLFSRSYHTINQNRVAEYVKLISAGARPKVVTYHHYYYNSPTSPHYIIDGHHKLLAYMQLRVPAPAISITKDDESVKIVGNITPRITGAVKRIELKHILVNNDNNGDVSIYMDEELTPVIDEIFQEDGNIGTDLLTVLHKTWHSGNTRQHDWAEKRLAALAQNKNIGNKFGLYYRILRNRAGGLI